MEIECWAGERESEGAKVWLWGESTTTSWTAYKYLITMQRCIRVASLLHLWVGISDIKARKHVMDYGIEHRQKAMHIRGNQGWSEQ
jgi:hypothetical protein